MSSAASRNPFTVALYLRALRHQQQLGVCGTGTASASSSAAAAAAAAAASVPWCGGGSSSIHSTTHPISSSCLLKSFSTRSAYPRKPPAAPPPRPPSRAPDPAAAAKWLVLGAHPRLVPGLQAAGAVHPTPVQKAAMAAILSRDNLALQSPTGSGKTLAYLVPLLTTLMAKHPARLVDGQPPKPRSWVGIEALVVAPSQELAMQIVRVARSLLPPNAQPAVQQLIGGANASRQRELMKKHKPLVGIGTPGRIAKLLEVQSLQMQRHAVVVFDEADDLWGTDDTRAMLGWIGGLGKPRPHTILPSQKQQTKWRLRQEQEEERFRQMGWVGRPAADAPPDSSSTDATTTTSGGDSSGTTKTPPAAAADPRWPLPLPQQIVLVGATLRQATVDAFGGWCGRGPPRFLKVGVDGEEAAEADGAISAITTAASATGASGGGRRQEVVGKKQQQQEQEEQPQAQRSASSGARRRLFEPDSPDAPPGSPPAAEVAAAPTVTLPPQIEHRYHLIRSPRDKHSDAAAPLADGGRPGPAPTTDRVTILQRLLATGGQPGRRVLVFVGAAANVEEVRRRLEAGMGAGAAERMGRGYAWEILALHGDMPGPARQRALASFQSVGPTRKALILSDLGARGLDLPTAHLTVQLDAPSSWQQYVHRAGRVGRMGARGLVVTVVDGWERRGLLAVAARLGVQIERVEARGGRMVPMHEEDGERGLQQQQSSSSSSGSSRGGGSSSSSVGSRRDRAEGGAGAGRERGGRGGAAAARTPQRRQRPEWS